MKFRVDPNYITALASDKAERKRFGYPFEWIAEPDMNGHDGHAVWKDGAKKKLPEAVVRHVIPDDLDGAYVYAEPPKEEKITWEGGAALCSQVSRRSFAGQAQ